MKSAWKKGPVDLLSVPGGNGCSPTKLGGTSYVFTPAGVFGVERTKVG